MSKKKVKKSLYNHKKGSCKFSAGGGWCKCSKHTQCSDLIKNEDGSKACYVEL